MSDTASGSSSRQTRSSAAESQAQHACQDDSSDIDPDDDSVMSSAESQTAVRSIVQRLHSIFRQDARRLSACWRQFVWMWCRREHPEGKLNFPKFALDNLEEDLILRCLDAEFGADALHSFWSRTQQKWKGQLAIYLGLSNVRLLALFFGAATSHTLAVQGKKSKHIKKLVNRLQAGEVISFDSFMTDIYPEIICVYAERSRLDITQPADRVKCVFARRQDLPFGRPLSRPSRARETRSSKRLLYDMLKQAIDRVLPPPPAVGLGRSESPESSEDETDAGSAGSHSNVSGIVDSQHYPESDTKEEQSETEEGRGSEDLEPLPSPSLGFGQLREQPSSPTTSGNTGGGSGRPEGPENDFDEGDFGVSHNPPSPIERFSASPPALGLGVAPAMRGERSLFEFQFNNPFANGSGSQPPRVSPAPSTSAASPKPGPSAKVLGKRKADDAVPDKPEADDALPANWSSPGSFHSTVSTLAVTPAALGARLNQGQDSVSAVAADTFFHFTPEDIQRIEHGIGMKRQSERSWLNDHIMEEFSKLLCFSTPSSTTIPSIVPFGDQPPTHHRIAKRLLDQQSGQHLQRLVVCPNIGGCHWAVLLFTLPTKTIELLDSLGGPAEGVSEFVKCVLKLLPEEMAGVHVTTCPVQRQTDTHNCGVWSLVHIWHRVMKVPERSTRTATLWRRLLLSMAKRTTLLSQLPALRQVSLTSPPDRVVGASAGDNLTRNQQIIDASLATLRSARNFAQRSLDSYLEQESIASWLTNDVSPVTTALLGSASAEVTRLEGLCAKVDNEIVAIGTLSANNVGAFPVSRPLVDQSKTVLKGLHIVKEELNQRLGYAQSAVNIVEILRVDEAILEWKQHLEGLEPQITRARQQISFLDVHHI